MGSDSFDPIIYKVRRSIMKIRKRIVTGILALILIFAMSSIGLADTTGEPGQTVSVSFGASGVYGMDGSIGYSNSGIFSSIGASCSGLGAGDASSSSFFMYDTKAESPTVTLSLTISPSAAVGDSCTITFQYETSDENGNMSAYATQTATVTVVAPAQAAVTPSDNSGSSNDSNSSEPEAEAPTAAPAAAPTEPAVTIDYTALEKQISKADALESGKYTAESWERVSNALASAKKLKSSRKQSAVDDGAKELEEAIAGLVEMDYTELENAIQEGQSLSDSEELGELWNELVNSMERAAAALTSGDQEEVDAAAAELEELTAKIQAVLEELRTPEIQEVPVEVRYEVPVEPDEPYCNITMHRVWPVLFVISAILNVAMVVWYVIRQRRNHVDDTPLVDYDIDDDVDDDMDDEMDDNDTDEDTQD
jgi:hypothetical protein